MKKLYISLALMLSVTIIGSYHSAFAQAQPGTSGYHLLVKCTGNPTAGVNGSEECNFNDFIAQINAVINLLFYISVILATISFIYCGFLFLTAGGDTGKVKQAKEIAYKVIIGFIWIFAAWLIVHFITSAFGLLPGASLIESQ